MKKLAIFLTFALLVSCGGDTGSGKLQDNGEKLATTANDCSKFVPEGFTLEKQLDGCGFSMATAKNGDGICPRVLIIVKDDKLVRISKEIKCKSIVFGGEDLVCSKLSEDVHGVPVEFEMGGNSIDDTFIKIIDDKTFKDVPVDLGAGFVARDFADSNYDGYYELIVVDNRWNGLKIFEKVQYPFTQKIAVYKGGKFVDETSRFVNHLDAGINAWSKQMTDTTNEIESAKAAVVLALIYKDKGQMNEGVSLMEKIINGTSSQILKESIEYFLREYKKGGNPDWFYPARKQAWELLPWQPPNSP